MKIKLFNKEPKPEPFTERTVIRFAYLPKIIEGTLIWLIEFEDHQCYIVEWFSRHYKLIED